MTGDVAPVDSGGIWASRQVHFARRPGRSCSRAALLWASHRPSGRHRRAVPAPAPDGLSLPSSQRQRDFLLRGPAIGHHLRAWPLARHQLFLVGRVIVNRPLLGPSHQRLLGLQSSRGYRRRPCRRRDDPVWLDQGADDACGPTSTMLSAWSCRRPRSWILCGLAIIWGQDCPPQWRTKSLSPKAPRSVVKAFKGGAPLLVESGGRTQHAEGEKSYLVLRSIGDVVILRAQRTVPRCGS